MARRLTDTRRSNRSLRGRLANLETEAGINAELPPTIGISFVKPNGECYCDHVEADGRMWHRNPNEPQEDFQRRVLSNIPPRPGRSCVVIFWDTDASELIAKDPLFHSAIRMDAIKKGVRCVRPRF